MSSPLPPEAHHYRRSQTPESPRPVHIPEPSNIPVLENQMDPVFNDTTTYDIVSDNDSAASKATVTVDADGHSLHSVRQPTATTDPSDGTSLSHQDSMGGQEALHAEILQKRINNHTISAAPSTNSPLILASTLQDESLSSANSHEKKDGKCDNWEKLNQSLGMSQVSTGEGIPPQPSNFVSEPSTIVNALSQTGSLGSDLTGVNFQSLLDTLTQPHAEIPRNDSLVASPAAPSQPESPPPQRESENPLPLAANLPPRPPPQESHTVHTSRNAGESTETYRRLPSPETHDISNQLQESGNRLRTGTEISHNLLLPNANVPAANGLPPPPLATFQQSAIQNPPLHDPSDLGLANNIQQIARFENVAHSDQNIQGPRHSWVPDAQEKYDQFLRDERIHVAEGAWDRFPPGSRLFVGNLPTDKVTKNELFHIFSQYGRLAQISLKQAYGFVQFLNTSDCHTALTKEQNIVIGGRKVHLEISKPQKASRNTGQADGRVLQRRRSRSPERTRVGTDRVPPLDQLQLASYRHEAFQRGDDHHLVMSRSPRSYRDREEHQAFHPSSALADPYGRVPSPPYHKALPLYRSPPSRSLDEEAMYPLPRRDPRDVPDVQILILEDIDQSFSQWIEDNFKQRGLKPATMHLNPHVTLAAAVKRQIVEGVQAVVKLTQAAQYTYKISLQVFDRGAGVSSVDFHEYVDLDLAVAADIVLQARRRERFLMSVPANSVQSSVHDPPASSYSVQNNFTVPLQPARTTLHQRPEPQGATAYRAESARIYEKPTSFKQGAGRQDLQSLLHNLRQPSMHQSAVHSPAKTYGEFSERGTLIENLPDQSERLPAYPVQQNQRQYSSPHDRYLATADYASATSMSVDGGSRAGHAREDSSRDLQNIMNQLACYKY